MKVKEGEQGRGYIFTVEQSNEMLDVSRGAGGVRWIEKGLSRPGVINRCMS